jgi:quercetin dioxygenase-like cupin family protein
MSPAIASNGKDCAMTKPDLQLAGGFSPQAYQRKLLFESTQFRIQCWLEHLPDGSGLARFSAEQSEEILLIQGDLDYNHNVHRDLYLCLTPEQSLPVLYAGNAGAALFRMCFGSATEANNCQGSAKPPIEALDFGLLAWNEIPARRANDPGARIAELSTNASRTRITSLMDCRPGWILHDHDHPSDVLTFCVRGGGVLGIEDQSTDYHAGHLVKIPAGVRHRFETGVEGALLAVFVFEPFLSNYGDVFPQRRVNS